MITPPTPVKAKGVVTTPAASLTRDNGNNRAKAALVGSRNFNLRAGTAIDPYMHPTKGNTGANQE
jgi:hypothetical protein